MTTTARINPAGPNERHGTTRSALYQRVDVLRESLSNCATLKELSAELQDSHGVVVSVATLRRFMMVALPKEYARYLAQTGRGKRSSRSAPTDPLSASLTSPIVSASASEYLHVEVATLTGAALDWAVAFVEGCQRPSASLRFEWDEPVMLGIDRDGNPSIIGCPSMPVRHDAARRYGVKPMPIYSPSTLHSQAMALCWRERISLTAPGACGPNTWSAHIDTGSFAGSRTWPATDPMAAICRAYVGTLHGEHIAVPIVLLKSDHP